jgi:LacI family transcriptional regulator
MSGTITIYDIAKAVGTSPATISKALNGRHDVSDALREKIIETAASLGYRPNVHARGLKMKKSWLVGMVYGEDESDSLEHPLFLPIMNTFKRHMEHFGYELLFLSQHSKFIGDSLLSHAFSRQVDGLLLINVAEHATRPLTVASNGIPMVACDAIVPTLSSVITDNILASKEAVAYLYDLGHRKIGHIAGPSNPVTVGGDERLEGFVQGMYELGEMDADQYVVRAGGWTPNHGRDAFIKLMEEHPNLTAVYCAADFYVMGILQVCRDRGIRIPDDISVIGFDDVQWTAFVEPGFTTFRQNREQLGIVAANRLLAAMDGDPDTNIVRIPAELIVRGSCRSI